MSCPLANATPTTTKIKIIIIIAKLTGYASLKTYHIKKWYTLVIKFIKYNQSSKADYLGVCMCGVLNWVMMYLKEKYTFQQ